MSTPQPNPDSGEKPAHRTANWTPQDAAEGCRTRKVWAAIYQKTLKDFQSTEIQRRFQKGVRVVYTWLHENHVTWAPRRYVAQHAMKYCAVQLRMYTSETWPKEFNNLVITDKEKPDLDIGYQEFLESKTAAAVKPESTSKDKKNPTDDEKPKEKADVKKEEDSDSKQDNDLKRKRQADLEQEHASANKKQKHDIKEIVVDEDEWTDTDSDITNDEEVVVNEDEWTDTESDITDTE